MPVNPRFFISQNTEKVCKGLSIWESACVAAEGIVSNLLILRFPPEIVRSISSILMNFIPLICMALTERVMFMQYLQ